MKWLSAPKLPDDTALTMAKAILEVVNEWKLQGCIKDLCFSHNRIKDGSNRWSVYSTSV